ncbi:MAG TPA: hypothetical protein VFS88_04255 [Micavibrio sp.]|nr:hypothetical protein [Micavibrio sp.]
MASKQSGNAIILILIAIFLFGALAATFTRGMRAGQGNLSANQARLAASEIADYFNTADKAMQKLRRRGCSEDNISFMHPEYTSYFYTTNQPQIEPATTPSDGSCELFESTGGGLNMNIDPEEYQIPYETLDAHVCPGSECAAKSYYDNIAFFSSPFSVLNVGTNAAERSFRLSYVQLPVCREYNKLVGVAADETIDDSGGIIGDDDPAYAGKTTFCKYLYYSGMVTGDIFYVWLPK